MVTGTWPSYLAIPLLDQARIVNRGRAVVRPRYEPAVTLTLTPRVSVSR